MIPHGSFLPEISRGEKYQILFVISSRALGKLSKKYLERPGLLEVTICPTGNAALSAIKNASYDLILSDYDLDDMDAIHLSISLQNQGNNKPLLLFSVTDRDREILNKYANNPSSNHSSEHDISIIFNEQAQKIAQSVELYRTRNRLELYTRHLEELVEERTKQLQIAQRFAVIGELATMIGHDMRNPLQVITNMQYLMDMKISRMTPEESSILHKYGLSEIFLRIGTETRYLNKIISDLQDYARDVNLEKTNLCPSTFLEQILEKLSPPESITLVKDFEPGLSIQVDPFILSRVMENLINNAIQAMEKGGTLTMKLFRMKEKIVIRISDTGKGIPLEVQEKIFDPLYTTKPKGTGLGLSVSKRLIEEHGGKIQLIDTSLNGTTFEVTLPLYDTIQNEA